MILGKLTAKVNSKLCVLMLEYGPKRNLYNFQNSKVVSNQMIILVLKAMKVIGFASRSSWVTRATLGPPLKIDRLS
jgi:hypothetical protein